MLKDVIIPEHIEKRRFCDMCGEEITDYSSSSKEFYDGTVLHFHTETSLKKIGKTCEEIFEENFHKYFQNNYKERTGTSDEVIDKLRKEFLCIFLHEQKEIQKKLVK